MAEGGGGMRTLRRAEGERESDMAGNTVIDVLLVDA